MTPNDLLPKGVDALPERVFNVNTAMDILPYRKGHFMSPYAEHLQLCGEKAPDSNGVMWVVREDGRGVFKSMK